jgi:hypothetical protein
MPLATVVEQVTAMRLLVRLVLSRVSFCSCDCFSQSPFAAPVFVPVGMLLLAARTRGCRERSVHALNGSAGLRAPRATRRLREAPKDGMRSGRWQADRKAS